MTDELGFLAGGGAMGKLVRRHDWGATPFGAPVTWPQSLRTAVSIMLNTKGLGTILWGPDLRLIYNDRYAETLAERHPDALGRPMMEVWGPTTAPLLDAFLRVMETGEGYADSTVELPMLRDGEWVTTWWDSTCSPIRGEDGGIIGLFNMALETTGQVAADRRRREVEIEREQLVRTLHEAQERQTLLNHELGHRLKNLLTIVQAVATQTIRQSNDLATAGDALSFRLAALGRAADVLTAASWDAADMATLARGAIDGQAGHTGRISIDGPPIRFNAQVSLALTLALHELATNATKYGALSNGSGHVDLCWAVQPGNTDMEKQRFTLSWRETGGPLVEPPSRRGFGSLLIERSLRSYFRGSITMNYDPSGLVFTIDAPLAHAIVEGNS